MLVGKHVALFDEAQDGDGARNGNGSGPHDRQLDNHNRFGDVAGRQGRPNGHVTVQRDCAQVKNGGRAHQDIGRYVQVTDDWSK